LDPRDWLLWLSEEVQTSDWASVQGKPTWAIGLACNLLFMIALSNGKSSVSADDDVFGDYTSRSGSGWLRAFCAFLVLSLTGSSLLNTFYVFTSTRKYRLFERNLEQLPKTPSARRVRVDDSPIAVSPVKYLADKLSFGTAEQRAHPDETHDVVELSVWDPPPLCLRLFTLFSPAHAIVYWSFLPTSPLDSQPSVTIVRTICLAALITAQSFAFEAFFTQQVQDKLILSREVLHEYDTKYVHPSINRPARDVAIQTPPRKSAGRSGDEKSHKEIGTDPMDIPEVMVSQEYTIVNRGFKTNPNPAYASHYDKNNYLGLQNGSAHSHNAALTPAFHTPATQIPYTSSYTSTGAAYTAQDMSSPIRAPERMPPPSGFTSIPRKGGGDGGSFGVYTSAASPLKKAASHSHMRVEKGTAAEQVRRREGSPLKRMSLPSAPVGEVGNASALNTRFRVLKGDSGAGDGGGSRRQSGKY
jgi:hypothetical protein